MDFGVALFCFVCLFEGKRSIRDISWNPKQRVQHLLPKNKNQESSHESECVSLSPSIYLSVCLCFSLCPHLSLQNRVLLCRLQSLLLYTCGFLTAIKDPIAFYWSWYPLLLGNPLALSLIQCKIPKRTKSTSHIRAGSPCLMSWWCGHITQHRHARQGECLHLLLWRP